MRTDVEFDDMYGQWLPRTPLDAADLFAGYTGTWWIAGGWALEAYTGVHRHHEDLDPSVLLDELPILRSHLRDRLHLWMASSGALKPLWADSLDAPGEQLLIEGCNQLWTRRSAQHPWEYDILLAPGSAQEWVYRRAPEIRMPMTEALWEKDSIRYLQPEIQLLYKARGQRPKDEVDFEATLPFLNDERRRWLREALLRTIPDHDWLSRL